MQDFQTKHSQHSQSATSAITNSASVKCLSTTCPTSWPDYRMHVFFLCSLSVCLHIINTNSLLLLNPFLDSSRCKGISRYSFEWLLILIQAVFAFQRLLQLTAKCKTNQFFQVTIISVICCHRAHACKHIPSAPTST